MLLASMALFLLAALGGLYLAGFHLTENRRVASLARAHGGLALAGLALLGIAIARGTRTPLTFVAAGLLAGAAALGLRMRALAIRQQPVPPAILAVHVGLALLGSVLLFTAFATAE